MSIPYVNYCTSIKYLSGVIREFDISKANISILYTKGKINKKLYEQLYQAPKLDRQIYIGNLIKCDHSYEDIRSEGLIEYKNLFYKANEINISDIVSIHNDSIFILNKNPKVLNFDTYVNFTYRGNYISFYKLGNLEIYYHCDSIVNENEQDSLCIKGINDNKLLFHDHGMIDFLKTLFYEKEYIGIESTIKLLKNFSNMYLQKILPIEFYREFNSESMYKFFNGYLSEYCKPNDLQFVDINYNYNLLRELFSIYASLYFSKV